MSNNGFRLPIDTSSWNLVASGGAKPVLEYGTKEPRIEDGQPLFNIELVFFGADEKSQVFPVKFPGTPPAGLKQGVPVRVIDLVVIEWTRGDQHGLAFRAARVEPLNAPTPTAKGGTAQ